MYKPCLTHGVIFITAGVELAAGGIQGVHDTLTFKDNIVDVHK